MFVRHLEEQMLAYSSAKLTLNKPHSSQVFDVLITRIGLSRFVSSLDGLLKDPAFVEASSSSALPHQVTRAFAAAAVAGKERKGEKERERGFHVFPNKTKQSTRANFPLCHLLAQMMLPPLSQLNPPPVLRPAAVLQCLIAPLQQQFAACKAI